MVPVLNIDGESPMGKNYYLFCCLFFVVNKIFEKYLDDRCVQYLEKNGLISNFKYVFKGSHLTVDLLIIAVHRDPWAFNIRCANRDIDLGTQSTFISGLHSLVIDGLV